MTVLVGWVFKEVKQFVCLPTQFNYNDLNRLPICSGAIGTGPLKELPAVANCVPVHSEEDNWHRKWTSPFKGVPHLIDSPASSSGFCLNESNGHLMPRAYSSFGATFRKQITIQPRWNFWNSIKRLSLFLWAFWFNLISTRRSREKVWQQWSPKTLVSNCIWKWD